MVIFVCSSCGSSLKKNQVEKHWMSRCGQTKVVSCMDCSKEFCGQEYAAHIKCITEDEKYGGSQFKAKEKKGEKKQEAWMSQIKDKVANTKNMEPKLKELLNLITNFTNIPRKKHKFKNFIMNSTHVGNPELIDKAWEVFQAANTTKPGDSNKSQVNGTDDNNKGQVNGTGDNKNQVDDTSDNSQSQSTEVDKDDMVPNGNSEEQVSKLSKKERKEERRKKQDKKKKKQKVIENTQVSQQSKRKLDEEDGEPTKKKKKRKHENEEQLMDKKKTELVEAGGNKNKKKKKREHENENQVMETETPEELVGGKTKKRKIAKNSLNGSLVANENHSQESTNENQTPTCGDSTGSLPNSSSFKWKIAIKTVLEQAPKEGMKMSKLHRKVLALYLASDKAASGYQKSKEELSAILTKKLQLKNDKYVMCNDRVKLRV